MVVTDNFSPHASTKKIKCHQMTCFFSCNLVPKLAQFVVKKKCYIGCKQTNKQTPSESTMAQTLSFLLVTATCII